MACERDREPIPKATLTVNGQAVELSEFVQSFIGQTVIGMISSLRGVEEVHTVNLVITREPK